MDKLDYILSIYLTSFPPFVSVWFSSSSSFSSLHLSFYTSLDSTSSILFLAFPYFLILPVLLLPSFPPSALRQVEPCLIYGENPPRPHPRSPSTSRPHGAMSRTFTPEIESVCSSCLTCPRVRLLVRRVSFSLSLSLFSKLGAIPLLIACALFYSFPPCSFVFFF